MSGPLERRLQLLMLLRDSGPLTRAEIGDRLPAYAGRDDSVRQQFERDKRQLKRLGVPIRTVERAGEEVPRYTVDRAEYDLAPLDLTPEERTALALATALVDLEAGWDDGAVRKLGSGSVSAEVMTRLPAHSVLPTLHEAAGDRHPVRFRYRGRLRTVHGHGLLFREGRWYLVADDDGTVKTFRVDRIEGDVEVDATAVYERPDRADLAAHLPRDPIAIGVEAPVTATVRVSGPPAEREARRRPDAVRRRLDDGAVELELAVTNRDAFRSWVLSLRDRAEVVGPPELRADVVGWLEAIVAGDGDPVGPCR